MRKKLTIITVLTAMIVASVLLTSSPASAAPTCYSLSCNGQDPQSKGCSADAGTMSNFTWDDNYFELRYSRACNAVWVRGSNNGPRCFGGFQEVLAYSDYDLQHWVATQSTQEPCYSQNWTNMESFTYWIQFCFDDYYRGIHYCRGPF